MTYTPVELRHVKVGRSVFGYNRSSVDRLIEEVADSFEATWRDRGALADRVEALEKETTELRRREELLAHTLVAAEQTGRELRDQAAREAESILAEARQEARAVLHAAQDTRERLMLDTRRIEAMLRSALAMIEHAAVASAESAARVPEPLPLAEPAPLTDGAATAQPQPEPPAREPEPASTPPPAPAAAPLEPRSAERAPEGWPEETGEMPAVSLPPAGEPSEAARAPVPVLRRIMGGRSDDFDWGE